MDQNNGSRKVVQQDRQDRLVVTYYTDPLCCWSWAFEPHCQEFCDEYYNQIECCYVMGGMIPNWQIFRDPVSDISKPAQMVPHWIHAAAVTHAPIDFRIWQEDPPTSSYPACIAVKNAFLQSRPAGELYLRAVRRAGMTDRLNIAKQEVLSAIAEEVSEHSFGVFDAKALNDPFNQAQARDAFRSDLQNTAVHKIQRFPTLIFTGVKGEDLIIAGFSPFDKLKACMDTISQTYFHGHH